MLYFQTKSAVHVSVKAIGKCDQMPNWVKGTPTTVLLVIEEKDTLEDTYTCIH